MGNLGPKSEVHGNFLVEEMRSHVNQYSIFVNILLLLTFCIECLYCNITDDITVSKYNYICIKKFAWEEMVRNIFVVSPKT